MNDPDQTITFLFTHDLEATSQFYQNVMGFPLTRDQGSCRIFKVKEASFIGFCTHLEKSHPEGIILTLVTNQVDEWFAHLSAMGVEFSRKPSHNAHFGIYHFMFKDPNGYLLEIQDFDEPLK